MIFLFIISFAKKASKFTIEKTIDLLHKFKIIKYRVRTKSKLNNTIDKFYESAKKIRNNKKTYIKCFICNLAAFPFLYSIPLILLFSTGDFTSLNVVIAIVACSFVMIIGSFIPIPGGTGGLEYAFVKFFGNYISGYVISTLVIMWRFITYYLGMILGALALSTNKRR